MRGVSTHVSDPYSITDYTTDKYIYPYVRVSDLSLINIRVSRAHFYLEHLRLRTTAGQPSSSTVSTRPSYLK